MSQHRPDPEPDGAFERLRAADPAAGRSPDPVTLDAAVRSRVGGVGTAPGDELGRARAARGPRRWVAVAAVAAGTLVVGSVGGYAVGLRSDGGATQAAAPAISLGAAAGTEELGGSATQGLESARSAPGAAVPEPAIAADTATSATFPWFGGRTVFTAQGLSEEGGTARAWSYDAAGVFGAGTAARVAAALGVAGEPRLEGGTWVVGPQDGTGPTLQLQPDGVTSVSYYDPTRDPFGCREPVATPESGSGGGTEPAPARDEPSFPPCEPRQPEPEPAPQGDDAVAVAREVMTAAGMDAAGYELEAVDAGTPELAYVTAHEVVDGQRTGLAWSLTLVASGVQSLYGGLAPRVPLGDYDVVSPAEAVTRLTDPRFGLSAGGPVIAAAEGARVAQDSAGAAGTESSLAVPAPGPDAVPSAPSAVEPGAAIGWPVREVVLTGARLGLAQHTQPDGATVLVPAYELSADDGSVWSVIAVAESGLDFSAS